MSRPRVESLATASIFTLWAVLVWTTLLTVVLLLMGGRAFWPGSISLVERRADARLWGVTSELERPDGRVLLVDRLEHCEKHRRFIHVPLLDVVSLRPATEVAQVDLGGEGIVLGIPRTLRDGNRILADGAKVVTALTSLLEGLSQDREHAASGSDPAVARAFVTRHGLLVVDLELVDGSVRSIPVLAVREILKPGALSVAGRAVVWVERWVRFLTTGPFSAGLGGGILPALVGTALLVVLMAALAGPLGVLAGIHLHEFGGGAGRSFVRASVGALAGMPGFVAGIAIVVLLVITRGGDTGGGILWAALALAVLSLPVVVVSTEEALAAVPDAWRLGALACGATRGEVLRRVVLPQALPGILTGWILAVGRAAGEVTPLLLTGVVKLSSGSLIEAQWPFFQLDREFMHLGFHALDLTLTVSDSHTARQEAWAAVLLLLLFTVLVQLLAQILRMRYLRRALSGGLS